jgi:hypothetical protein
VCGDHIVSVFSSAHTAFNIGMIEIDDYILELIYEAMTRHYNCDVEEGIVTAGSTTAAANSSRVQEAACQALSELLHCRPHLRDQIGEGIKSNVKPGAVSGLDIVKHTMDEPSYPIAESESNFQLPLHQSLMYVLMCYMTNADLFQLGCDALYNMVVDCSRLQELLRLTGAQQTCLIGMEHHLSNLIVQEYGCRALRALSSGGDDCKLTLKSCGGLDAMVRILSWLKHGNNEISATLIEEAIGVIACLGNVDHSAINSEVHSLILDAMSQFPDNQNLQEVSLEAIGTYFAHADTESKTGTMVVTFDLDNTQHVIVQTMEKHAQNGGIQRMGCFILRHILKPEFLGRKPVYSTYASVISKALEKHQGNANVLAEATLATLELIHEIESTAQVLVDHHVHIHLFSILEQGTRDLFRKVSECIYVLGVTRKLNNKMLSSAVQKRHYKAISALMEIGADPSANLSAMGGLSAFCLACDKGDFRAVHIMLKKGMSEVHVQPGLNIAKKKHHHWVVGLLLYHSFLKLSSILWGNLDLGNLNPLWLYKSLGIQTEEFFDMPDDLDDGTVKHELHYTPDNLDDGSVKHELDQRTPTKSESQEQPMLKGVFSPSPSTEKIGAVPPDQLDNTGRRKSSQKSSTVSLGKDKKISDVSIASYDSDIIESGPPSRKSASVGSTSSHVSMLSDIDNERRKSEPGMSNPCWKMNFTAGHHHANLQEVKTLEETVERIKELGRKIQEQIRSRPSPVTDQESEDLQSNSHDHHEARRSKTSRTGVLSRRTSRCDLAGVPLEPINMDVGVVEKPEQIRERRRSIQGTMSGAVLPLTTPDILSKKVWPSTLEEGSEVPSFSPRVFRRVIKQQDIDINDDVPEDEDEVFTGPLQPFPQSEMLATGSTIHTGDSVSMTSEDSECETNSASRDSSALATPRRNLSSSIEKPGKTKGPVNFIDVSSNGINSLSDLAEADRRLLEKLKYVTHLDLSQNELSEIPVSLREWLEGLTNLNLQYNNFLYLPGHLLLYPRLQVLEASHNKIERIEKRPDAVVSANSSPLKTLDLSHNQIKTFPPWLCKVANNLVDLNMSNNSVEKLPEGPLELYCLESLCFAYNEISEIPEQMLKKCPNLGKIDLTKNKLGTNMLQDSVQVHVYCLFS